MKIAVCMKQVPAYSEGNMDEKTGLLIRSGLKSVVNVYDMAALETALRVKEAVGAQVEVFTMGPENAAEVLKHSYAMGADEGYLISGKEFGGADVLATSYTLMQAIKSRGEYELILCGKQTTDGDTAQVSGALARLLEIPHYIGVSALTSISETKLEIKQLFEEQRVSWELCYPVLLAVERHIFPVRMPTLKLRIAAGKKAITRITISDLEDTRPFRYGMEGSATKVKKIFPPPRTARQEVQVVNGGEAAAYIMDRVNSILEVKEGDHADKRLVGDSGLYRG